RRHTRLVSDWSSDVCSSDLAFEKALSIRPDFAETYVGLGNAFQRLRRLEAAVSAYRKAIALQGDLVSAHSGLGTALQELKRAERSEERRVGEEGTGGGRARR